MFQHQGQGQVLWLSKVPGHPACGEFSSFASFGGKRREGTSHLLPLTSWEESYVLCGHCGSRFAEREEPVREEGLT